jgi:hypothetical protein
MTFFASSLDSPNAITYANDDNRVRSLSTRSWSQAHRQLLQRASKGGGPLPYSMTETTLDDLGINGFSVAAGTVRALPLLVPEQLSPMKTAVSQIVVDAHDRNRAGKYWLYS